MRPLLIQEGSRSHWGLRCATLALAAAVIVIVPETLSYYRMNQFSDALVLVIAALGLNLVVGYGGQISLGHAAFFGIGAYSTAILVKVYGWSPGWTLYAGACLAFVIGALASLPSLKVKGAYLALVTLAISVLFPRLVGDERWAWLTNGQSGFHSVRHAELPVWPLLGELPAGQEGRAIFQYWLTILVACVAFLMVSGIVRSRVGRALVGIRDNELAATVMGVNVARTKILAFAFSAALCSLAGSLSVLRSGTITPDSVSITLEGSIVLLLVVVIGGAGTMMGPIIGGFTYFFLSEATKDWADSGPLGLLFAWSRTSPATLIFAVLLIVTVFAVPGGIAGLLGRLRRRLILITPAPTSFERRVSGTPEHAGDQRSPERNSS